MDTPSTHLWKCLIRQHKHQATVGVTTYPPKKTSVNCQNDLKHANKAKEHALTQILVWGGVCDNTCEGNYSTGYLTNGKITEVYLWFSRMNRLKEFLMWTRCVRCHENGSASSADGSSVHLVSNDLAVMETWMKDTLLIILLHTRFPKSQHDLITSWLRSQWAVLAKMENRW